MMCSFAAVNIASLVGVSLSRRFGYAIIWAEVSERGMILER